MVDILALVLQHDEQALLPETTLIFLEAKFTRPGDYNVFVEIIDGRIAGQKLVPADAATPASADLATKLSCLRKVQLFETLPLDQLRLLAFASD